MIMLMSIPALVFMLNTHDYLPGDYIYYNFSLLVLLITSTWRRGDLMVTALVSRLSGPYSSPGQGHCVVFLGKTLSSYSVYLHPGV